MISYGSQLSTLKRQTIQYITEHVKNSRAYRNKPGDLWISSGSMPTCYMKDDLRGNQKLDDLSMERLVCIADKIHFRPLEQLGELRIKPQLIEKTMKIESNIESKYSITQEEAKDARPNRVNYMELPLKKMKEGECVILFEDCTESNISSRRSTVKRGLERAVKLMRLNPTDYMVSETKDGKKVGIWRIA